MASRPALLALTLSAAAVLGYLAYRVVAPRSAVEPPASTTEQSAAPAAAHRELAGRLPDFVLDDLVGEPRPIRSWSGHPLVINFWATWCAPCLREIPMLKAFQTDHPDLTVIGIAVDKDESVKSFAADMQFNYPVLVGQSDAWEAAAAFGIDFYALPFTVFTAADGSVLGVHTGELHAEQLDELLATLADLDGGQIDVAAARSRLAGRL